MLSKLRRWLREGAILLVLLAGVIILLDVWRSPQMPAMFDSTPLHTLDGETVTLASISEERPVLLYFWASWCGPCRMLSPVLEELEAEYGGSVRFCKVNVDDEPGLSADFGITSIPTLLFFENGRIVNTVVGLSDRGKLAGIIDRLL